MNRISDSTFSGAAIALDDHEYEGCTFISCTFTYAGTGRFRLAHNTISPDCRFAFSGAAANAIDALQAIFRMGDWGRAHVLATFQQIAPGLKDLN